jgi:hypothetical protein
MWSHAQGSKPKYETLDVDDGAKARCSDAGPGGSIFRSPSSPVANINDPKVNSVS